MRDKIDKKYHYSEAISEKSPGGNSTLSLKKIHQICNTSL